MGFVANRNGVNDRIMEEIASGGNGFRRATSIFGEYNKDLFGGNEMHLSEDAIKRFLQGI